MRITTSSARAAAFGNTLRCFAVSSDHQGEGLLNQIITHLIEVQCARGNLHLFLYTKIKSSKFFGDLGFYEIARVEDTLVFMENRRDGFGAYLRGLEKTKTEGRSAALVMNANPFTLGHQYLVETAAAACDTLHLFVVSEDASLVPFAVRKRLVAEGVRHLSNVVLHDSGPYIISNATFPSYFLKDETAVIEGHARLDLAVFTKIAAVLNVTARYVGEEPASQVTGLYNQIMKEQLPKAGIHCIIVPRKQAGEKAISSFRFSDLLLRSWCYRPGSQGVKSSAKRREIFGGAVNGRSTKNAFSEAASTFWASTSSRKVKSLGIVKGEQPLTRCGRVESRGREGESKHPSCLWPARSACHLTKRENIPRATSARTIYPLQASTNASNNPCCAGSASLSHSGCHWTPRQKRASGFSSASTMPSSLRAAISIRGQCGRRPDDAGC